MPIERRMMTVFICERCEHEWIPRDAEAELPRVCPKCKSPYWNLPRTNPHAIEVAAAKKKAAKKPSRAKRS